MGDANISRDRFVATGVDPSGVLYKLFQQGTYIADNDATEIGQVTLHRAARSLYRMSQGKHVRFDTGWVFTGGTNVVNVSGGEAAIIVMSEKSFILKNTGNPTAVSGWTTPTSGNRTDCLYLDITLPISDSGDDVTLINPAIGKETAVDQKMAFTFAKREGYSVPPTPVPSGHYYVAIATINRINNQASIANSDIVSLITPWNPHHWQDFQPYEHKIHFHSQAVGAFGHTASAVVGWNDETLLLCPVNNSTYTARYRVALWKTMRMRYAIMRFAAYGGATNDSEKKIRMTCGSLTPVEFTYNSLTLPEAGGVYHEIAVDVSSAADGARIPILIELKGTLESGAYGYNGIRELDFFYTMDHV